MCGRFVSASPPDEIAKYFGVDGGPEQLLEPSFNVAPSKDVYVVVERGGVRKLDAFHWGLVPFWSKDPKTGNKMINARAEGIETKAAYKQALKKRRCVIPVDGFFEWKKVPGQKRKQPMYIRRKDGEPIALAGLWEVWRPKEDEGKPAEESDWLRSCTIITTEPNEMMAKIHDRMPVILPPSAWDKWLDPENNDIDSLVKLLKAAPEHLLEAHPVSLMVNNVRETGAEIIEPAEDAAEDAAPDTLL